MVLTDHISKEMNELNLVRCQRIPKRPGSDWRDLPDEKVLFLFDILFKLESRVESATVYSVMRHGERED